MKNIFRFLILLPAFTLLSGFDGYHRYYNIDVLHYEFALKLSDSTDSIMGRTVVGLRILEKTDSVVFDLKGIDSQGRGMHVTEVLLGDKEIFWKQDRNKLYMVPGNTLKVNDSIEIIIEYRGIPADGLIISRNKFGDRTFFADHWPDRAHNYLPCIDHPYDKATVDFVITAPEQYSVVANGILTEESSMSGNMKLTHWSESVPIPVKVMTFGAARFAVRLAGQVDDIPVWSWVFPQNRTEGFNDYDIAVRPLEFYISLIGKYPFEKLANVQSKTIYGGLENAGTIFYHENSVTGLGKAETLIAHEIAHQWFGDCITEADWYHIWLSEGFATYLTSMYIEYKDGREKLASEMARSRTLVIKSFEKRGGPLIDTTIVNLKDLLGINSYQKGAWVLHMLRNEIGDESFKKGLISFYDHYKNSNVLSSDFQHTMEAASGTDLGIFFKQWLYMEGQPELRIWKRQNIKEGNTIVYIEQKQRDLFQFSLELLIKDHLGERIENISVKDRVTRVIIPVANVSGITPDPEVKLLFKLVNK
jgi:aminopeptidase N